LRASALKYSNKGDIDQMTQIKSEKGRFQKQEKSSFGLLLQAINSEALCRPRS